MGDKAMTATTDAIVWFKTTFGTKIDAAIAGTPFSRNMIVAIAMQETSYIWRPLYKTKSVDEVLALCVGDTIDGPRRKAFPRSRADLEAVPRGKEMFRVGREALERLAKINKSYAKVAKNKNKFCRGYGMFQYDLQFFKDDPDYFLDKKWATFDGTLGKCVSELKEKLRYVYGNRKRSLTHKETVYVAIAYNHGSVNLNGGLKQGHENSSGQFYGQLVDQFLTLAERSA
jgi:hypothetical protein